MDLGKGEEPLYCDSILRTNPKCKIVSPIDVTTYFFKFLRKQIELIVKDRILPENIEYAVSIPASFGAASRANLLKALSQAGIGLQNYPFIDEPLAAYLKLLHTNSYEKLIDNNSNVLVVDLGAGTFDLSIIQIALDENGMSAKNLSVSKFTHLGGDLIDRLIAERILLPMFLEKNRDFKPDKVKKNILLLQLSSIAEKLKIKICKNIFITEKDQFKLPAKAFSEDFEWCDDIMLKAGAQIKKELLLQEPFISYKQFASLMKEYLGENQDSDMNRDNIHTSIHQIISKSPITMGDIDMILLNGKGCKNPYFVSYLAEQFPESKIIWPDNIGEQV